MYSYVKNKFVKNNKALISIKERGFRFSDGFFDTILICNYQPYQWQFHKEKLAKGNELFKFNIDLEVIEEICKALIVKNNFKNGLLRVSISRGLGRNGYRPKPNLFPTLIIETIKLSTITPINYPNLWLSSFTKIPKNCLPSYLKTMQGSQSVLARLEAIENECFETLLLNEDGDIAEGSSTNIFWIRDNKIYTPSLETPVYDGSIRNALLHISPLEIIEGKFQLNDLLAADEIFVTNIAIQIQSIYRILPINKEFFPSTLTKQIIRFLKKDIKEKTRQNAW